MALLLPQIPPNPSKVTVSKGDSIRLTWVGK